MTTTPPTGPGVSGLAEYASMASPSWPVMVTVSDSTASYIGNPFRWQAILTVEVQQNHPTRLVSEANERDRSAVVSSTPGGGCASAQLGAQHHCDPACYSVAYPA